jgi:rapamycin-insensitive companion of mTOR
MRMGMQMEDKHFMALLTDTQVSPRLPVSFPPIADPRLSRFQILLSRDHNKWNYDILLDVVQGPLLNPRRLEEALKASKFGRRLMSFFHPLNHRFSDIKKTKVSPPHAPVLD